MAAWKAIGCAVDGSTCSLEAMRYAASLAREAAAELKLLHVDSSEPEQAMLAPAASSMPEHAAQIARWESEAARLSGREVHLRQATGSAADEILKFVKDDGCDVLVMGTKSHNAAQLALGSIVTRVLAHSPCPVLVVPAHRTH